MIYSHPSFPVTYNGSQLAWFVISETQNIVTHFTRGGSHTSSVTGEVVILCARFPSPLSLFFIISSLFSSSLFSSLFSQSHFSCYSSCFLPPSSPYYSFAVISIFLLIFFIFVLLSFFSYYYFFLFFLYFLFILPFTCSFSSF